MGGNPSRSPMPVQINIGYIVDVLAGPRWYLVRQDADSTTGFPCKDISGIGIGPVGPRKISIYSPGTAVLYVQMFTGAEDIFGDTSGAYTPMMPGYIIGAAPSSCRPLWMRADTW